MNWLPALALALNVAHDPAPIHELAQSTPLLDLHARLEPLDRTERGGDSLRGRVVMNLKIGLSKGIQPAGPRFESLLQVLPGEGVELVGPRPADLMELVQARGLSTPFERWVEGEANVTFHVSGSPESPPRIEFSLLTYLRREEGPSLHRERFALELRTDAELQRIAASDSRWGVAPLLHIGGEMEPLALPRADGSTFDLFESWGDGRLIVATYLAHW